MKKMKFRFVLPGILVILLMPGILVACKEHSLRNQKPNIIFIYGK